MQSSVLSMIPIVIKKDYSIKWCLWLNSEEPSIRKNSKWQIKWPYLRIVTICSWMSWSSKLRNWNWGNLWSWACFGWESWLRLKRSIKIWGRFIGMIMRGWLVEMCIGCISKWWAIKLWKNRNWRIFSVIKKFVKLWMLSLSQLRRKCWLIRKLWS